MMKSKSEGSRMSKLRELDLRGLRRRKVPTAISKGRTEAANLAFCPLLLKYEDKGMCGSVNCRECELPYLEYENVDFAWLCTVCARGTRALPYFGGGECEICGLEFCVLGMSALG